MPSVRISPPTLHDGQREVLYHPARYKVLAAGRRWGKTRLAVLMCVMSAVSGGRAWWVAPTYKIAAVGWRLMRSLAVQLGPLATIRRSERCVLLGSGGAVYVRSADNPDGLRGEGLDFVALDEAALIAEEAWTAALRPALSDRRGRAIFISTPKGHNWFWRLWQNARSVGGEWAAWQFPTSANPFIDPAEVEAARAELPSAIFAQEFLAEFIADGGGVFRGVTEAATAQPQERAQEGHTYVFGVDWGKYQDFTVVAVLDATLRSLVYIDRYNRIDYSTQRARLLALAERFRPSVVVAEANAMGEPIIEALRADGLPVMAFTMTAASKTHVVDMLALALERGDLRIINHPVLVGELQAFTAERLPGGGLRYGAPAGFHDDCVVALMLAWWAAGPHGRVEYAPPIYQ